MILKFYELNKINLEKNKIILFYGNNTELKKKEILQLNTKIKDNEIFTYDEKEILENEDLFLENLFTTSLFSKKKTVIVLRATDKLTKIVLQILKKKNEDLILILDSDNLEKKSKLRGLFEKDKNLLCIAFYPDTFEVLLNHALSFFKVSGISISRENINLLINRCNGDRALLNNEMEKLAIFAKDIKKISTENLIKLSNLSENHSIFQLVDSCLCKNIKKTINIINENKFNSEDNIMITRAFLSKAKKILNLSKEFEKKKDLNVVINNSKPPIFWKEKDIIKQQILKWDQSKLHAFIFDLNKLEYNLKKNSSISVNLITDFIIQKTIN